VLALVLALVLVLRLEQVVRAWLALRLEQVVRAWLVLVLGRAPPWRYGHGRI
jgi:hypothetical protein